MGGVAVIVLAILALLGVVPRILTPIAGIVFGIAFMVEGAAIAARQSTLIQQTERTDVTGAPELEVGRRRDHRADGRRGGDRAGRAGPDRRRSRGS